MIVEVKTLYFLYDLVPAEPSEIIMLVPSQLIPLGVVIADILKLDFIVEVKAEYCLALPVRLSTAVAPVALKLISQSLAAESTILLVMVEVNPLWY